MQGPAAAPPLPANWLEVTLALAVAATVALALALAAGRVTRRIFVAIDGHTHLGHAPLTHSLAAGTVRLVRLITFALAFAIVAFPALDAAGVKLPVGLHSEDLGRWATQTGVRIAAILLLAFAVVRVLSALIHRAVRDVSHGETLADLERQKRAKTVAGLGGKTIAALIWTIAVLMVLRELDIDITPVLTGAGIVGLAVGFGAQTLVRDVISGFFLILEDQVRVGDVAEVNGRGGLVEELNLRTIVLRDFEGTVHVFPNGAITTLANRSKDFAYYVIDLPMDYADDTDEVTSAVMAAGAELQADPAFAPHILAPLESHGVDAFGDSQVTLKFRIKTVPLKQWEVGRALRRRIKKVFDQRGIRIPYPQMTLHMERTPGARKP